MTDGMADANFRNISDEHRRATDLFYNNGLDIRHASDQAQATDDCPFRITLQYITADVGVILRHRLVNIVEC